MRGVLTDSIQAKALRFLKREISQEELRLIPYFQYCLINDQHIDRARVNETELKILEEWNTEGLIKLNDIDKLQCSKKFWNLMSEVIWIAYARHWDNKDG